MVSWKSVGVRTGPDADNLLILDIDGDTAWEFCQQYNCSKRPGTGWKIWRSNAADRFKVAFQINDQELEEMLDGVGKAVITTSQKLQGNEQIELFWAKGQCIVLGDHVSGGHYQWEGSPRRNWLATSAVVAPDSPHPQQASLHREEVLGESSGWGEAVRPRLPMSDLWPQHIPRLLCF